MSSAGLSETIFLSTSILLALSLVGVLSVIIQDQGNDARARGEETATALRTDIRILNDPQQMQTSPLLVYARNTGDATLAVDDLIVLLDGEVATDVTHDILASSDDTFWPPDTVLAFTVNDLSVTSGPHEVRLVAGTGIEASLRFTV